MKSGPGPHDAGVIATFVLALAGATAAAAPNGCETLRLERFGPPGTGIIRGRVTDRGSGEPLSRVMVTLVSNTFLQDEVPPCRNQV